MGVILAGACLVFALWPAVLYARNMRQFRAPPAADRPLPSVSILIPARNEARSIESCVAAALGSRGIEFEIVVLDDHSEDDTAKIVQQIAEHEPRARLEKAPELPAGWCGKQHACYVLSKLARRPVLCFVDADVLLAPDGVARMTGFLESSGADFVSGFPQQITLTFFERLLMPLIHFLLLGFLPLARMRRSRHPSYGAGCGQLFVIRREAYEKSGGHQLVKSSLHDGLTLPRAFRAKGFATDLCDATSLAACRMYQSAGEVWRGLAKNANEGLASPRLLVPATAMLVMGQVLPLMLLVYFLAKFAVLVYFGAPSFDLLMTAYQQSGVGLGLALSSLATAAMYYPRLDAAVRFRQSMEGALLHPLGMLVLLAIQWYAAGRALCGRTRSWKGRMYRA